MDATATPEELDQLRALLVAMTGPALDEVEVSSAEELELLVLGLLPPFASPELPSEAARLLPAALAERGDGLAAGMLAAVAAFGPPVVAGDADAACARLAARGVRSPWATDVGASRASEACRLSVPGEEAELLGLVVPRRGGEGAHPATVMLDHEPCGGVVVDVLVGEAGDLGAARSLFARPRLGLRAQPVAIAEVTDRLRGALEHMVAHDVPLAAGAAEMLPFVQRALAGSVAGWPRPSIEPPDDDEDEDDPDDVADAIASAFAEHLEEADADALLLEHAPLVAHQLMSWKLGYGDGDLERWTSRDLREFLLGWMPRQGDLDEATLTAVPPSLVAFFGFLADEGLLTSSAARLAATVRRLTPDFERRSRDPRHWGPAKAVLTQMRAEGVEPTDQEALDAWLEEFNARPFEERDRVLGPVLGPAPGARAAGGEAPRGKRRSAPSAKKRNRRR